MEWSGISTTGPEEHLLSALWSYIKIYKVKSAISYYEDLLSASNTVVIFDPDGLIKYHFLKNMGNLWKSIIA